MADIPNIVCTGMLDTKGDEVKYLARTVKELGGNPIIMDISLGHEADWADIRLSDVLRTTGHTPEDVFLLTRSSATEIVGAAGAKMVQELYRQGKLDGIISWAGGIGTTTATCAMRALPLGVPKVMLATGASGNTRRWLAASDIFISNPISEKGINSITEMTVGNGCASVISMARYQMNLKKVQKRKRPLAAFTLYGTTTAPAARCAAHMEQLGWDTIYFHQVGTGATMEDLIGQGEIHAVFDLTPGEITNNYYHAQCENPANWTGERYTAAFNAGIPTITASGGMDQSAFGKWELLPDEMKKQFETGERVAYKDTNMPYFHNPAMLILPPTLEENKMFAHELISKLNKAKGPAVFLMPMKGWSAYDQSAAHANKDMGWAEDGNGPTWIPDNNNPEWSRRAVDMWEIMEAALNRNNSNIDLIQCDIHILDESFSDLASEIMDDMLNHRYRPGMYRDKPYVIK